MFALDDFYEKGNLVILFIPKDPNAGDLSSIESVINHHASIKRENASLLVLSPQSPDNLFKNRSANIPVLLDADGNIRESYSKLIASNLVDEGDVLTFILDSYGAPWICLVGQDSGESFTEELLSWLLYLSIQCPE